MAEYSVIADVSGVLLGLLRKSLCPEPMQSPEAIQLASPAGKKSDFLLGIYLFDFDEIGERRGNGPIRRLDNTIGYPPKPLALSYMLFLNTKAQMAPGAEDEQRILGRCVQTLMDNGQLEFAAPALAEDDEEDDDSYLSVSPLHYSFEEKSKIWSALNIPYQTAYYFSVGPVMLSSRRSRQVTRVVDAAFITRQKPPTAIRYRE